MFNFITKLAKFPSISIASIVLLAIFFLSTSNHYKDFSTNDTTQQVIDTSSSEPDLENRLKIESEGRGKFQEQRLASKNISDMPSNHLSPWLNAISTDFVEPSNLKIIDDGYIHIAVLLKNITNADEAGFKLRVNLLRWFNSMVTNTIRMPLHIIFLTDKEGIMAVRMLWFEALPPFALYNFIENKEKDGENTNLKSSEDNLLHLNQRKVLRFQAEFVNIDDVINKFADKTKTMQKFFNHPKAEIEYKENDQDPLSVVYFESWTGKYNNTLYYLAPFYHEIFPQLPKLVVTDVDVLFQCDPADLYRQFSKFSNENVIGIANELTPHYYHMLDINGYYKRNRSSVFGMPGLFQGLNVGIMLYDLHKMRENELYLRFITPSGTTFLAEKYQFTKSHLGEQDWFNLLQFEIPNLVYVIPCEYNFQLDISYQKQKLFKDLFEMYHTCYKKDIKLEDTSRHNEPSPKNLLGINEKVPRRFFDQQSAKIIHGNGDSLMREN